ncbi:MAG: hypothetical protein ACE5D7_02245 [Fidelibacterota bacterium]
MIINRNKKIPTWIFLLQISSVVVMWIFVTGIILWIFNLINLSIYLKDAQNATLGISLVVMPVYILLASVLTYVFVGLNRKSKN